MSTSRTLIPPPSRAWLPVAMLVCLCACGDLAAGSGGQPVDWRGVDTVQDAPSSVRLRFHDDTLGTADLAFGAPRQCRVRLRRAGGTPPAGGFSIVESSGGVFCDALYPGSLDLVEDAAAGAIRARVVGMPSWSLLLRPANEVEVERAVVGRWSGRTFPGAAAPVPVRIEVGPTLPGDRGGRLRFDGGRDCSLPLQYEGSIDGVHDFTLLPSDAGGGYCDRLVGERVRLSLGEGGLRYRIVPEDPDCPQTCMLERAEP